MQEITLPAVCDIAYAERFLEQLEKMLSEGSVVSVKADAVERITTPCVQIILSLAKTVAGNHGKMSVCAPSPAIQDAFADLGLEPQLNEWSDV